MIFMVIDFFILVGADIMSSKIAGSPQTTIISLYCLVEILDMKRKAGIAKK
jgi:hypothetical protein